MGQRTDVNGAAPAGARRLGERDEKRTSPYRDWLAGADSVLEGFFREDAPEVALIEDPWTLDGLETAVAVARELLPDYRAVVAPENRALVDRFGRFVGEVFVRQFEGRWRNMPHNGPIGAEFWPMVEVGGYSTCIAPHCEFELAVVEGRMRELAATPDGILTGLFTSVQHRYRSWTAAGRPSPEVWATAKLAVA